MRQTRAITTDTTEIHRVIGEYSESIFDKFENLKEMVKFLYTNDLPKLNQEATNSLNRLITSNEIEAVIESAQNKAKIK